MKRTELRRTDSLKRTSGPRRRSPLGHASREQKAKVEREGLRLGETFGQIPVDPAHITPRTQGGCDHEDCIVPLPRDLHRMYDQGELDVLPYLTLEEQAHAVSHLGILGALKRTTGDVYVPESAA